MRYLLMLVLLSLPALAAGKAAMITDVQGKATVTLPGGRKPLPAETLAMLPAGARLSVQSGTVSLIYTAGGRQEKATGPCELTVGEKESAATPPGALAAVAAKRAALAQGDNLEKIGGVIGRDLVVLKMDRVLKTSPVFAWEATAAEAVPPYVVEVLLPGQSEPVWTGQSSTPQLAYSGPPLQNDTRYDWVVKVANGSVSAGKGRFRILSPAREAELAAARQQAEGDPVGAVLLLRPLVDNDLLEEAALTTEKLLAARPDAGLYRALQRIYEELGKEPEAKEAGRKARELRTNG